MCLNETVGQVNNMRATAWNSSFLVQSLSDEDENASGTQINGDVSNGKWFKQGVPSESGLLMEAKWVIMYRVARGLLVGVLCKVVVCALSMFDSHCLHCCSICGNMSLCTYHILEPFASKHKHVQIYSMVTWWHNCIIYHVTCNDNSSGKVMIVLKEWWVLRGGWIDVTEVQSFDHCSSFPMSCICMKLYSRCVSVKRGEPRIHIWWDTDFGWHGCIDGCHSSYGTSAPSMLHKFLFLG
jgi:hypothetical protein